MKHFIAGAPLALARIEYALHKAGINIDIIDADLSIKYMDPHWSRLYGRSVGKKCYAVFEGRRSQCPGCGIARAVRTGKVISYDATLPKEGDRPIKVIAVPFRDERGVQMVAEVNIDISERRTVERSLRESEQRFKAIASFAGDFIFIINPAFRVAYVNAPAAGCFHRPARKMVGADLTDLFMPEDHVRMKNALAEVFRTGRPLGSEERFSFPTGEAWLSTRLCPIKDAHGRTVLVLGISRDISALKQAERVLARDKTILSGIVREKSSALLAAQRKLDQSERLAEIGTLAASIAHELRNPLAAIRMAVFNIRRKTSDLSLESHMTNIERKIEESDRIIGNLLTYGKISMPDLVLTDLCLLLDECIDSARERFRGHAVSVRKNFRRPCVIRVDPTQMKEVFNNILNNSYEAMTGRRGALMIAVKSSRVGLVVTISDTGVGIPAENIARINEPFFSTKKVGTGLGLPVCKKIIDLHGGTIKTASAPDKGTTITITIPRKKEKK